MTKNWMVVLALVLSLAITGTAMAQTDTPASAANAKQVENVAPVTPQPAQYFPGGRHGRFPGQWSGGPMAKFIKDESVKKLQDELIVQEQAFRELLDQKTVDEAKAADLTQKISDLKARLETKRLEHILAFKKTNPDWQPMMMDMGPRDGYGHGHGHGYGHGYGPGRFEGKGCQMMMMGQGHGPNHGPRGMHGPMTRF